MNFDLESFYHHYWRECDYAPPGKRSPEATDVWVLPGFHLLTPQELLKLPLAPVCPFQGCVSVIHQPPPIDPPLTPVPLSPALTMFALGFVALLLVARRVF